MAFCLTSCSAWQLVWPADQFLLMRKKEEGNKQYLTWWFSFSGLLCCVLWSSGWFKQHWVPGINRLHFRCLQAEDKVGFWSPWRCHVSLQNDLNPDNDTWWASSVTLSRDVLNPGRELVASGYALYGSATVMILTTGDGVQGWAKSKKKCTGVLASL